MAKEMKLVKCIVVKGERFYDNNRDPALCKEYKEGEVVVLDMSLIEKLGANLRELTAEELKMTPSELKKRELGEAEATLEQAA
jgi:hypothetical protein